MTNRKPTTLEYALLGLIRQEPQSGYDLRKIFETTAMGSYSGSPGAIYPALKRLEERGLVEGDVDSTKALRPRKIFRTTREGAEALFDWLSVEVEREDVERRMDELMLRFAFHALLGKPDKTRRFLVQLLKHTQEFVVALESQARHFPEDAPPQPRLALAAGIAQFQAMVQWARHALNSFPEEE